MDLLELKNIKDRLNKLETKIDELLKRSQYKQFTSSKSFSGPNKIK